MKKHKWDETDTNELIGGIKGIIVLMATVVLIDPVINYIKKNIKGE